MSVIIKFKLLDNHAKLPSYAHKNDAGFDLYSVENSVLKAGKQRLVSLGIAAEVPTGYFVSLRDRSGLASKHAIHVLGGVVDSGYRGEWKVILCNLGDKEYKIKKGDRVVQGILHKIPETKIVEVNKLGESERQNGGYGSTGK